ncbi:MAG: thioredoxin-like protein [Candidatus Acidoferrum typicum]|jgi:Fe-S cluster biogenesis protein NfuA|nr:thioredoxin-like protein [Candidatus Acidoferrum typicum]
MAQDADFQKGIQRIGELVEQLESAADPNTRAVAKELLESLMALHGSALERMLEIAFESGGPGETIIRKCGSDELVSSVLLLYGLHPESLQTRVTRALENSRTFLESHSANAELVSVHEGGRVTVRLEVKSNGCGSTGAQVKSTLEAALQNAAPDAASIVVEEIGKSLMQSGFVSVAQLENGTSMTALYAARAERSGD